MQQGEAPGRWAVERGERELREICWRSQGGSSKPVYYFFYFFLFLFTFRLCETRLHARICRLSFGLSPAVYEEEDLKKVIVNQMASRPGPETGLGRQPRT